MLDDGNSDGDAQIVGMPLGIATDSIYQEAQTSVQPGHCLIFYSDGLINARNSQGETFGLTRLQALVNEHSGDAEAIVEAAETVLRQFQEKGGVLPDDLTLMVLQRLANAPVTTQQPTAHSQRVVFPAPDFDVDQT
jgi:sigma-B regulation protein RsbU (phosphoserine phosphatase)